MSINLKIALALTYILVMAIAMPDARAGVPFVAIDGYGGIAYNPLAYTVYEKGTEIGPIEVGKPRIGMWDIILPQGADSIDWTSVGAAIGFNKRLELSYSFETTDINTVTNIHKTNLGAKFNLLEENTFGSTFVPAVSIGAVWKSTNYTGGDIGTNADSAMSYYLVLTKTIKELPIETLVSAGVFNSRGEVTGLIGFNGVREFTFFGNVDFIPASWVAVGFEYKQGANFGSDGGNYVDADYYNIHVAYLATSQFTAAIAYAHAGSLSAPGAISTSNPKGFGSGLASSLQFAF
jgi:hypothetical protein